MHESLDPKLAGELARPLPPPIVPIFDIHMHSGRLHDTAAYVAAAKRYGVTQAVNMTFGGMADARREYFGDFFTPCGWPVWLHAAGEKPDWDWFTAEWVEGLAQKPRPCSASARNCTCPCRCMRRSRTGGGERSSMRQCVAPNRRTWSRWSA